jgi:hypothetical protein
MWKCLIITTAILSLGSATCAQTQPEQFRAKLRLQSDLACAYAAAYLTDVALHLKLRHWMHVYKMEEVTFNTLVRGNYAMLRTVLE